ncbi:MAG TPA: glycoside hydrolase family 3 N-terminal domain-containing protein, partial [Microthrixaceae bacterium]|nr:glycoside hydrolase family 3 N-terminal domain-containing protein [Microthrixaceae bacterium]
AGVDYEAYARRVGELGFTMILGPSIDVGSGSALGSRSFGTDPARVAAYGLSVTAAIQRAGLVPVVKHWPGLGRGDRDTHIGPATVPDIASLRSADLVPFDQAIAQLVPAVMVSHANVPGLTGDAPASLSSAAIDGELRGRQGYDGLVMTDSLGMGAALRGRTQPEVAELAIAAGADIAMVSGAAVVPPTHARLVDAIDTGRLPPQRVREAAARSLHVTGNSCQPI